MCSPTDSRCAVGKNVDIVVDPAGGDRFTGPLRTLREHGRSLVIGFTAGSIPTVAVNRPLLKQHLRHWRRLGCPRRFSFWLGHIAGEMGRDGAAFA